jgi:ribosomal protein S12 methylthiotransferase accessory factor YcaO
VEDPSCREVLDKYERAEVTVAVWETTSDVGIPSFECTIMERTDNASIYPAFSAYVSRI